MIGSSDTLGTWSWKSMVSNTFPLMVALSFVVLAAGISLEDARELLAEHAILAVMVPTMVAMGGNLGAMLSSRLSTRFHLGTAVLDPRDRVLWANVAAILALAASVFTILAVAAHLLGRVIGATLPLGDLLVISLVSGMSLAVIAIAFSLGATYAAYRLGVDPDDTTIPVVTSVVDVFGMVIFIAVSTVVL